MLAVIGLAALTLGACAEDRILPVGGALCGNGEVDEGEDCDSASAGCVRCKVAPGWECDDTGCKTKCGDRILAGTEECDPPDGKTCDSSCWRGTKPAACDLSGYWIARQTNFSTDKVLNGTQTSTNWFFYKIAQTGGAFTVTRSLFCGIQVSGSADVRLAEASARRLMYQNPQHEATADRGGNVRTGSFASNGKGGCDFFMAAHWYLRGAGPGHLPPLPWKAQVDPGTSSFAGLAALPSKDASTGAVDLEGGGKPGAAYDVTGILSGRRFVVQRDWEWRRSDADHPVAENALEFVAADLFDGQENILSVTCPGTDCSLIASGSFADNNAKHRVTMRWLGAALSDARVRRVAAAEPGGDEKVDLATCEQVRLALPHDRSRK